MRIPKKSDQQGFVLVVALILLAVVSLLALNGVAQASMGERLSGNYIDRTNAQAAAEQAIAQALAMLQTNGDTCLAESCTKEANAAAARVPMPGLGSAIAGSDLPTAWTDSDAAVVTIAASQRTTAQYTVNYLSDAAFARPNCQAYNLMGRGVGLNAQSVVLLQTVAYVCPTD